MGDTARMSEVADWSVRGTVFYGGARDGEQLDLFPAQDPINLSKTVAGKEIVEVYRRTRDATAARRALGPVTAPDPSSPATTRR